DNPETLVVTAYQQNEFGDNFLEVHQRIEQRSGAMQTGEDDVNIQQLNNAGNNHADVMEQIFQFSSETAMVSGSPMQEQNGSFVADPFEQNTQTGSNFGTLAHELHQDGNVSATGSTETVQRQFSDEVGHVDQFAEISDPSF